MIIVDIINNLSFLAALCVFSDVIDKYVNRDKIIGKISQGALFGIIAVLAMLKPLSLAPGLFFDGRSIIISLSGYFFGPMAAVISASGAILCRAVQGGVGSLTGILVIISSALIGSVFYFLRYKEKGRKKSHLRNMIYLGVLVHIVMFFLMFTLPLHAAMKTVQRMGFAILVIYPLASIIVGKILFDMSEKKKYLKLHLSAEKEYRDIVENANSIILRMKPDGSIVFINRFGLEFFGYTEREIIGQNVIGTIVPEQETSGRNLKEFMEELLKNPENHAHNDNENMKKNRERVWVSWTNKPVFNIKTDEMEILSLGNDITDLKRAEIALKENEEKYRILLINHPDMVMLTETNGSAIFVSPQSQEVIGYPAEEVYSLQMQDFIHPEDMEMCKNAIQNAIAGMDNVHVEYRIYDKEKQLRYLSHTARPVWVEGKIQFVQSNVRNITETKKMELEKEKLIHSLQQSVIREMSIVEKMAETQRILNKTNTELETSLEKANEASRLKTEFMAMMSHEIRTPLSGIIGFTNLLKEEKELSNTARDYVQYLSLSANRLNELLTNLLELSYLQSSKKPVIHCQEFNIEEMLSGFKTLFQDSLKRQRIKMKYFVEGSQLIRGDSLRIQQILFNLIGNAVKFTENGDVVITAVQKNRHYLFEIRDTGIGMTKEEAEMIFEPFRQTDSDEFNRKYQGAGLGLTLCKKLVEILGGEISVQSEKNIGSVFTVKIPVPENRLTTSEIPASHGKTRIPKNLRVLYAEDDEVNFKYIRLILEQLQTKFMGFYNGHDLIAEWENNPHYDLILLDIQMPLLDGIECLHRIKQKKIKIPVMALTAYTGTEERNRLLSEGFDEIIEKPFSKESMTDKMSRLLSSFPSQ